MRCYTCFVLGFHVCNVSQRIAGFLYSVHVHLFISIATHSHIILRSGKLKLLFLPLLSCYACNGCACCSASEIKRSEAALAVENSELKAKLALVNKQLKASEVSATTVLVLFEVWGGTGGSGLWKCQSK